MKYRIEAGRALVALVHAPFQARSIWVEVLAERRCFEGKAFRRGGPIRKRAARCPFGPLPSTRNGA